VEGVVLFGDVIASRRAATAATAWLRTLTADLASTYGNHEQLAPFEFTQGDEIQGLLAPTADPTRAVLRASLHPARRPMRWVIVRGDVDPGTGPATQRSGPAFITARDRLAVAAGRRELIAATTGDAATDALLDAVAPVLGELLADLTVRQREFAWPILVEGLRQSEAAARLGVSRATVSVATDRAHLRSIAALAGVVRTLVARSAPSPSGAKETA
jgi:DNA-binding CsgD family transcriptional regulator